MKELALKTIKGAGAVIWLALIAPFIIPAFVVVKLTGGDPFSMDDMGLGFGMMCLIAVGIAVTALAFTIGYLI
jgi:hypothetical protein